MSPVAQWLVDQHLSSSVKKIIPNQHNRNCLKQLSADVLSAQSLLQLTERKDDFPVSGYYLAIDNDVRRQRSERFNQLRKAMRDFIHGPRVDSNSSRLYMCLGSYPIKLVFN